MGVEPTEAVAAISAVSEEIAALAAFVLSSVGRAVTHGVWSIIPCEYREKPLYSVSITSKSYNGYIRGAAHGAKVVVI